jgi:hypothetical protein
MATVSPVNSSVATDSSPSGLSPPKTNPADVVPASPTPDPLAFAKLALVTQDVPSYI